MGKNRGNAAAQLVDLVKSIIRDEESKRDQIIVGTVLTRNKSDDTYDIYIDTDANASGRQALMKGIPNESKHTYSRGDHVYVLKVRGQLSQGFIIGSVGSVGVSLNAKVEDLAEQVSSLKTVVGPAMQTTSPNPTVMPIPYTMEVDGIEKDIFAYEISWNGDNLPANLHVFSYLMINHESSYTNGNLSIDFSPEHDTDGELYPNIRIVGAADIFPSSDPTKLTVVYADIRPGNTRQTLRIAFTNGSNPIPVSKVEVIQPLRISTPRGFTVMGRGYTPIY